MLGTKRCTPCIFLPSFLPMAKINYTLQPPPPLAGLFFWGGGEDIRLAPEPLKDSNLNWVSGSVCKVHKGRIHRALSRQCLCLLPCVWRGRATPLGEGRGAAFRAPPSAHDSTRHSGSRPAEGHSVSTWRSRMQSVNMNPFGERVFLRRNVG